MNRFFCSMINDAISGNISCLTCSHGTKLKDFVYCSVYDNEFSLTHWCSSWYQKEFDVSNIIYPFSYE